MKNKGQSIAATLALGLAVLASSHGSVGASGPMIPFGCLGVEQAPRSHWLEASGPFFSPIGQVGQTMHANGSDSAFARRFAAVVGHSMSVTSVSRFRLSGHGGCAYGHDVVLGSTRNAVGYAAVVQLKRTYSLNQLMNISRFVHPPAGFVQFAVGRGSGYVALAGVTKTGVLITANVASATASWNFSGWPTTMMTTTTPSGSRQIPSPLTLKQLTASVTGLGVITR